MKKKIKINFSDFGLQDNENFILQDLKERYDVEISDSPDFVFYSCFGLDHYWKYKNCVKIYYTGEFVPADFSDCDYAIGFDDIKFANRYMQYPYCLVHLDRSIMERERFINKSENRRFCNFIYSNTTIGEGAHIRELFCKELSKYKHVDCPGRALNNMYSEILDKKKHHDWASSKLQFISDYKFTIAFENHDADDYITEKLIQPMMVGSIPIYRGGGKGSFIKHFNPESYINVHDYDSFDSVIKEIIRLDNDSEAYKKMLLASPVADLSIFQLREQIKEFIFDIIERGNSPIAKDPRGMSLLHQKSIKSYIRKFNCVKSLHRFIRRYSLL